MKPFTLRINISELALGAVDFAGLGGLALGLRAEPTTQRGVFRISEIVVPGKDRPSLADLKLIPSLNDELAEVRLQLVARFSQIEGYKCLSLTRALEVVKCQLALV